MQAFPSCCYIPSRWYKHTFLHSFQIPSSTFIPCNMFHFHTKQKVKSQVCTHKFCSQTTTWEMKKIKGEVSQKKFRILHNCIFTRSQC
jgi:hypothetical protein